MEIRNSTLDDIAAVIGFTATLRLAAWFGGTHHNLYVPGSVDEQHVIAKLVGVPAYRRLVNEWGNEHIAVPLVHAHTIDRRHRELRDRLMAGERPVDIAEVTGVSRRRVEQLRAEMISMGLLPENTRVFPRGPRRPSPEIEGKKPQENAGDLPGAMPGGVPDETTAAGASADLQGEHQPGLATWPAGL